MTEPEEVGAKGKKGDGQGASKATQEPPLATSVPGLILPPQGPPRSAPVRCAHLRCARRPLRGQCDISKVGDPVTFLKWGDSSATAIAMIDQFSSARTRLLLRQRN